MSHEEKRAHERIVVGLGVRVLTRGDRQFSGVVENLGVLGALVTTPDLETPFDVGDDVTLHIARADGVLVVTGEVLRLEQEFAGGDIRRAFAVRFHREISV